MAAEIHERNGSFDKNPNRRNAAAPKMNYGIPKMPTVLRGMKFGVEKWKHLTKELSAIGVLAMTDLDLLEQYCVTYQIFRDALAVVRGVGPHGGITIEELSANGATIKRSPYCVELHKTLDRLGKLMVEMGLTPSSRGKLVGSPGNDSDNELMDLLNRRGGLN